MAINQESFNTDLYKLLRTRGYKPVPKDAKNQRTQPEAAEVFNFTFTKDGKDYGDAWVTIDDAQNVVLYYNNEQEESPSGKSPNLDYDDSWSGLKRHLKQWSMNKQLSFELRNKDELGDDMAQRDYVKKKEKMNEGYHSMGNKASYNDNIPAVKIILQHNRKIEEGEQRYRNIAKIFLENQDGERFLAPTTRPGIAQVYARHIAEGGVPNDERWNHVKALCEEYSKMAGFVRATKNKQFMESAQQLVSEGVNHYQSLRETLGKLRGHRGYNMYFESWTPALMEDDTGGDIVSKINDFLDKSDTGNDPHYASWLRNIIKNPNISVMKKEIIDFADELNSSSDRQQLKSIVANSDSTINELFVQETVDPRIESVMPILARLNKNKTTTTVKEVEELAEWADSITEMDDGIPDKLSPTERKEQKERDKKEYNTNLKKIPDAIKKKLNLPDKLAEGAEDIKQQIISKQADLKAVKGNSPGDDRNRQLIRNEISDLKQKLKNKTDLSEDSGSDFIHLPPDIFLLHTHKAPRNSRQLWDNWWQRNGFTADEKTNLLRKGNYLYRFNYDEKGLEKVKTDSSETTVEEAKSDSLRRKFNKAFWWDGQSDPKDMLERIRKMSDKDLIALADAGIDDHYPNTDGSPRQFQIKAINRELKRRYGLTPKGNIKPDNIEEGIDGDITIRGGVVTRGHQRIGTVSQITKANGDPYVVLSVIGASKKYFNADDPAVYDKVMKSVKRMLSPTSKEREPKITAKKHGGDDAYSWAVFVDGRPVVTGLSQSEVPFYKKQMAAKYKNDEGLSEDLDADQKRVGQLGPTEKVGKKGARGKLVGANESVEINEDSQDSVANALYNRVTRVRTDLITKYGIGAINDAIDEVSSQFAGEELDEIGSSDVSGWIRQLEQILANSSSMSEGYRPGEINNGDQVQIKKDSPYYEPGTWTVSQCTDGGKCWIGDEDDRGWYIRTSELELADSMGFDDDDDFDPDFVYGKSEPEDDVDSNDFGDFGDDPRDTDPLDEIKRLIK